LLENEDKNEKIVNLSQMNFLQIDLNEAILIWGYPLMFLMMIIEGPVATLIAAFFSSLGYFNFAVVFVLSVLGDIVGDIVIYFLGYWKGEKFFLGASKFLGVKKKSAEKLKKKFKKNGSSLIFLAKATVGMSYTVFTLAGAFRFNFRKFLKFSLLGGIVWSSFLVATGYFFGFMAREISTYIEYAGYVIFSLLVITFLVFSYSKNTKRNWLLNNNKDQSKKRKRHKL